MFGDFHERISRKSPVNKGNKAFNPTNDDWFETHIEDQQRFQEALASHRAALINTLQITAHLKQSTLIQLCSLSAPEAASLMVYHVRNNLSGLTAAFEEYCLACPDLRAFFVHSPPENVKLQPPSLVKAVPSNFSWRSSMDIAALPAWKLAPNRPSHDSRSTSSAEPTTPTSTSSSSPFQNSFQLSYASVEDVIVLTAPSSVVGDLRPGQPIQILITVKEKSLAQNSSKLSFTLTATCLICRSMPEWHAEFSTDPEIRNKESSSFSLSKPVQQVLAAEDAVEAETYSLLATFHVPETVKCKCRRTVSEGSAMLHSKARPPVIDAVDYMLNITGSKGCSQTTLSTESAKTYLAQIPMPCNRSTHSRAFSYILPAVIKSRPIEIKIVFSWKIQTQLEVVSYLLLLKADENFDGLAKHLKKIGQDLHVDLVWKIRVGESSPIKSKKLKSGRHQHAATATDDISAANFVRLEGSICLNRLKKGSSATLGDSWYDLHVESRTRHHRHLLFSAPLHH